MSKDKHRNEIDRLARQMQKCDLPLRSKLVASMMGHSYGELFRDIAEIMSILLDEANDDMRDNIVDELCVHLKERRGPERMQ